MITPDQFKNASPSVQRLNPHIYEPAKVNPRDVQSFDEQTYPLSDEGKAEKVLQQHALSWLETEQRAGRLVILEWRRMDKKTTGIVGSSDFLLMLKGGRAVAAEAKVGKRQTTDAQQEFINRVLLLGGIAFVFRTLNDLRQKLGEIEG